MIFEFLQTSLLSTSLGFIIPRIAIFDWLPGRPKGLIFERKKVLKNLLLRNYKVDEADTLHTCL